MCLIAVPVSGQNIYLVLEYAVENLKYHVIERARDVETKQLGEIGDIELRDLSSRYLAMSNTLSHDTGYTDRSFETEYTYMSAESQRTGSTRVSPSPLQSGNSSGDEYNSCIMMGASAVNIPVYENVKEVNRNLMVCDFINFARQIANGMKYLHSQRVSEDNFICKICFIAY
jgi:hypothetical protein